MDTSPVTTNDRNAKQAKWRQNENRTGICFNMQKSNDTHGSQFHALSHVREIQRYHTKPCRYIQDFFSLEINRYKTNSLSDLANPSKEIKPGKPERICDK